ncbi:MAG: histidine--tRNA ligase [Bryobacterales bacterium]|nr:histidine--tRNA ligase [Bryobacterales bacterium]
MSVKPRLSRGLRDLLPESMIARQRLIDTVRGIYEIYGFSPLDTPAIEYLDVLSGSAGQEAQQSIFRVTNPEKEDLGLRFDLTVPLSRVVSQHSGISFPFRRYQVAQVWRADKPDPGRFRQFTQFDLDAIGAPCGRADVEIIAAICDSLSAIDAGPYLVRFSSREILNLLLRRAGIRQERAAAVFRVLDKLDKIGLGKVKLELTSGYTDSSGDRIRGVGLSAAQVEVIEEFLSVSGATRSEVLRKLVALFSSVPDSTEQLDVIDGISSTLDALGYHSDRVALDVSIARGLAYYTGPVFEAVLLDAPRFGSVFGGGRYDNLVSRFGGPPIPATGASMGVDRLLAAMEHLGRVRPVKTAAQVLVSVMDETLAGQCMRVAFDLRRAGIRTEIQVAPGKLGKQLKRANRLGIPYVVLIGSNEAERGVVTVKQMAVAMKQGAGIKGHGEWRQARFGQREVARGKVAETLRSLLDHAS